MLKVVHSIATKSGGDGDIDGDFALNKAIIKALPDGYKLPSANHYGSSAWTVTARLDVQLPNHIKKAFFLKLGTEEPGRIIMEGEYHSMTALHSTCPNFTPKPLTWGKFATKEPETYFFICDCINMRTSIPSPKQLCSKLAHLHTSSVSPTGAFGFHKPICHSRFPQEVTWNKSWTSFFTALLSSALAIEKRECTSWPSYDALAQRTLSDVVPRLLGVLETPGRTVKPSLIHGDLCEGNIGTDCDTGNIYIFDAGAYYAHHEMEVGMWRCARHEISKDPRFMSEYVEAMGKSEPVEEFEDRVRLYCVKMNVVHSAHHPGNGVRNTVYDDDMWYLVGKYAPFGRGEEVPIREKVEGEIRGEEEEHEMGLLAGSKL